MVRAEVCMLLLRSSRYFFWQTWIGTGVQCFPASECFALSAVEASMDEKVSKDGDGGQRYLLMLTFSLMLTVADLSR